METEARHSRLYTGSLRSFSKLNLSCHFHAKTPLFASYPLSTAVNGVYSLVLRLRLVPRHSGSTADLEAGGYAALPGGARAEAERRRSQPFIPFQASNEMLIPNPHRAMALKALDQRLANPAQNPGASAPLPSSSLHNASTSSSSSHHHSTSSPVHELANSHSHPPPPPRQNGSLPPQTIGASSAAGASQQQQHQAAKPSSGVGGSRGEDPDEDGDVGVAATAAGDKGGGVKGSPAAGGLHST